MQKAFTVPDWLIKNGAIFQINPRTFSAEGTIKAVTRELPFLAELGFGTMYLCPVFKEDESADNWSERQKKSNTGNPKNQYRIVDYFEIDSEFGTMDDLREFVRECHRFGLKVLLDLVYRHIGPSSKIVQEHPEFIKKKADGSFFTNDYNFPEFDFDCMALREYLYKNMEFYVGELDVDGFRCDSTDPIPDSFWEMGRNRIRAIKPDAVLINEGTRFDNLGICFDVRYCFGWHIGLDEIINGRANASLLREKWQWNFDNSPDGGVLLRSMDDHDTVTDWDERVENIVGHDGMELILTLTYLIDGVPMVYCGNELADQKCLSMFANRFFMGDFEVTDREDKTSTCSVRRQEIIKKLNSLRRESETLARGTTEWLDTEHSDKVICFKRALNGEEITVIGNLSRETVTVTVPNASGTVLMESKTTREGDKFTLNPFGYSVLKEK